MQFGSATFLREHLRGVIAFYHPACLDPRGGFLEIDPQGRPASAGTRTLVGTARMIVNHAIAQLHSQDSQHLEAVMHGLRFLREAHRDPHDGGYAWLIRDGLPQPAPQRCYGLAFVALAYARAAQCGVASARAWLDETWALLDRHFWEPQHGLYADAAGPRWALEDYRGQNANMHACEALIAAFEATRELRYLERAAALADRVVNGLAARTDGLVWEHFHRDWQADYDYGRNDGAGDRYRAWGFQPGHQAEWAKLLLILERHAPQPWHRQRAQELFDRALALGWDAAHEGVIHACDLDGACHDGDKYSWVQAECLAAAGLLAGAGAARYADWYERLWNYAWRRFVDHPAQAWMRVLSRDHQAHDDGRAHAGKTDYHVVSACHELLASGALQ
jgi:mannose/cellobiose epimerase-like protein (N-acyl-D-glucosamine 2-epimerase family)